MKAEIKRGQKWMCLRNDSSKYELHFVLKANDKEVVTWGWENSWQSNPDEFLDNFVRRFDLEEDSPF